MYQTVTPSIMRRTVPPAAETPIMVPVANGGESELEPEVDVADADVEMVDSAFPRLPVMVAARNVKSETFVSTQENHRRVGEPSAMYDSH